MGRYQGALECKGKAASDDEKKVAVWMRAMEEIKKFIEKETEIGLLFKSHMDLTWK